MRHKTKLRPALLTVAALMAATTVALAQDDGESASAQDQQAKPPGSPVVGQANTDRKDAMGLAPVITGSALHAEAKRAYEQGFKFIVSCQNSDGTWGSHDPKMAKLKNFGFGTGNRGSQDGVRHACTAIIGKALLRKHDRTAEQDASLEKAVQALLSTEKFAFHKGETFNTWGYCFKLDFLCDLLESPMGEQFREEIEAAADVCIAGLKLYQQADGGWNYYSDQMNNGKSMSFNTANVAEGLYRAEQLGLNVPPGIAGDAAKLLLRMRTKRGGFVYDARFIGAGNSVNELSAGARTAAAAEALAEMGIFGEEELERSLAIFDEGENWLEDGRKLIQPHAAVHQVSGYFFFYGYHYLSEFLTRLGDDAPLDRWERNAWTMIRTQQEDGSWWDTPAADYGDKWATGFALLVLQRYFERTGIDLYEEDQ